MNSAEWWKDYLESYSHARVRLINWEGGKVLCVITVMSPAAESIISAEKKIDSVDWTVNQHQGFSGKTDWAMSYFLHHRASLAMINAAASVYLSVSFVTSSYCSTWYKRCIHTWPSCSAQVPKHECRNLFKRHFLVALNMTLNRLKTDMRDGFRAMIKALDLRYLFPEVKILQPNWH